MYIGIHRRGRARTPIVLRRALIVGLVISLLTAGMALADQSEGDIVGPDSLTKQVPTGSSFSFDVELFIKRQGQAANIVSWAAPVSSGSCSGIAGTSAAALTLPTTWSDQPNGTLSRNLTPPVMSTVTVSGTAGAAGLSCSLTYTGTSANGNIPPGQAAVTIIVAFVRPADTTPPVITPNIIGTLGNNGWYVSDVTVSWTVADPESAITSTDGCGETIINSDTAGQTLTCSATSAGGTNSQSVTIKRDATAPTISGSASPAANGNGWNNTNVTVSFVCSDDRSGLASCGPDQTLSGEGAGQSVAGAAVDNAGNSASATVSGIYIDKTAPTASASASPGPNANGWNNTDVTVSFSGSDGLSGIDSCSAPVVLSGEGAGQSASGTCTDKAGNVSATATASDINIDKTAPTLAPSVSPNPVALGGLATASPNANDILSGVDTASCGTPDTSSVGSKSVSCTATDKAGNTATASAFYTVIYNWTGFFRPVDNLPTLNMAKAGSAIPVKFSLSGNQGLNIFAMGYPRSQGIACDTGASVDSIEETVTAGGSSLSYDPLADQYVYVWKTDKTWTGCRQLVVELIDGTVHRANFKFTK